MTVKSKPWIGTYVHNVELLSIPVSGVITLRRSAFVCVKLEVPVILVCQLGQTALQKPAGRGLTAVLVRSAHCIGGGGDAGKATS